MRDVLADAAVPQAQRDAFAAAALGQAAQLLALDAQAASEVRWWLAMENSAGSCSPRPVIRVLISCMFPCLSSGQQAAASPLRRHTSTPCISIPFLAALQLVLECFPAQQQALLAALEPHPAQQFAFLKSLVSIHQRQQQQQQTGAAGAAGNSSSAGGGTLQVPLCS